MDDYRTKRRFRQRKLSRQGYYELRQRRSRARRRAENNGREIPSPKQIADPENLIRIFYDLKQKAGHAPGPDGIGYKELGRREVAGIMRQLSTEIIDGSYEPSRARKVRIPKASGHGHRTLSLRSIIYRVVSKALADALTPYFDRMFLPGSHGFRPNRSTWSMLVAMERIMTQQNRYVIAQDDIANAFDNVPISYVMGLYRQYIPDETLLSNIEKVLRGHQRESRTLGIDQGSALSPLTLNVALHHALDIPSSKNAAHPPWLRYADNIVYLCQSVHEGKTAIHQAQQLLSSVGMDLKGSEGEPVDLSQEGAKAIVLGLSIRMEDGQISYGLTGESWKSLKRKLSEAYRSPNPHGIATEAIRGWREACAPAFEGKPEEAVINRILRIAAEVGYREISRNQLKQYIQSSRDRWALYRERAHKVYREEQEPESAVAPLTTDRPGISLCPRLGSSQDKPAAIPAHL